MSLTIFNTLSALPSRVADVVRTVRSQRRDSGGSQRVIDSDLDLIAVPATLFTIIDALRATSPDDAGQVHSNNRGKCAVSVHMLQVDRAVHFLSHLANSLADEGMGVGANKTTMHAICGLDKLEFTLAERTQDGDIGTSGQLVVRITSQGGTGLRRTWSDRKGRTIEKQLSSIVAGFHAFLRAEQAKREENDRRRKQQQYIEHRKLLAQQRKDREEKRVGHLRRVVELRREANDIRAWLATLPVDRIADERTELGRMIGWAASRQSMLESLTTLEAASSLISGRNLFPATDDLLDPGDDVGI